MEIQLPATQGYDDLYAGMDLLRFTTAGSVDDGKSTLIGRLLYDTRSTFEDQLDELREAGLRRGDDGLNLALLTDGLRAEREQGITIDVAYRYFATPRRKFIIADTPGHLQYTRNMVTGASSADLAVVLIDARHGVVSQSRRHGFIASLLRIQHVVVAVNKMDAVGYDRDTFDRIAEEFRRFAAGINIDNPVCIPLSALHGDNVAVRSENMPWYEGPTLLEHLETVPTRMHWDDFAFRFPVQYVVRPHQNFRGFAGRVETGRIRPGSSVKVLPSGHRTRVESIVTFDGPRTEALASQSIVITLADEIDVSRGDLIVEEDALPEIATSFQAMVCWMSAHPLRTEKDYFLRHGASTLRARIRRVVYRTDVDILRQEPATDFGLNDIGLVDIETAQPLCFDAFSRSRRTGSFILIDPHTNDTVAAGMIAGSAVRPAEAAEPLGRRPYREGEAALGLVTRRLREQRNGHRALVARLLGEHTPALARQIEARLFESDMQVTVLDDGISFHRVSALDEAIHTGRDALVRGLFEAGLIVILPGGPPPGMADAEGYVEIDLDAPVADPIGNAVDTIIRTTRLL